MARKFLTPIDAGASKVTNIANGTASTDAAAYGQAPGGIMTTLGDILYENATPAPARLAGSTSATKNFLTQTGTGSVSAAPAWGTIASADLPAATTSAQGAVQLDGTAGDIMATSTAAAAGTSTKAPAADHVHAQGFLGLFGDGGDGAVTLDGTNTYSGFTTKSGNTYTLTRDVHATSLTITSIVTLNTGSYRIYCRGTLTNSGTIANKGTNATSSTGVAKGPEGTFDGSAAGASGTTGTGASAANSNILGTGGGAAGGNGSSGNGGTGGSNATTATTFPFRSPVPFGCIFIRYGQVSYIIAGGLGGGGGGGDGTNAGGGGGNGGSVVGISAWSLVNNGTITAAGGNGFTPVTGNCGGGGGGGGGLILTYTLSAVTGTGSTSVAGGTHGSGVGSGTNGSDGSAGNVLNVVLA